MIAPSEFIFFAAAAPFALWGGWNLCRLLRFTPGIRKGGVALSAGLGLLIAVEVVRLGPSALAAVGVSTDAAVLAQCTRHVEDQYPCTFEDAMADPTETQAAVVGMCFGTREALSVQSSPKIVANCGYPVRCTISTEGKIGLKIGAATAFPGRYDCGTGDRIDGFRPAPIRYDIDRQMRGAP